MNTAMPDSYILLENCNGLADEDLDCINAAIKYLRNPSSQCFVEITLLHDSIDKSATQILIGVSCSTTQHITCIRDIFIEKSMILDNGFIVFVFPTITLDNGGAHSILAASKGDTNIYFEIHHDPGSLDYFDTNFNYSLSPALMLFCNFADNPSRLNLYGFLYFNYLFNVDPSYYLSYVSEEYLQRFLLVTSSITSILDIQRYYRSGTFIIKNSADKKDIDWSEVLSNLIALKYEINDKVGGNDND